MLKLLWGLFIFFVLFNIAQKLIKSIGDKAELIDSDKSSDAELYAETAPIFFKFICGDRAVDPVSFSGLKLEIHLHFPAVFFEFQISCRDEHLKN
jgi:hypothetical protein